MKMVYLINHLSIEKTHTYGPKQPLTHTHTHTHTHTLYYLSQIILNTYNIEGKLQATVHESSHREMRKGVSE